MNSARIPSQRLFYQEAGIKTAVFMSRGGVEIELGVSTATSMDMQGRIMSVFSERFAQQPSFLDLFKNNRNQLSVDEAATPRPHHVAMLSYGGARNPRFPTPMEDDAAIATAFLAVISSSPSSPSARPAPQRAALGSKGMAFGRYNSSPAPLVDPDSCYPRQRMIKRALAIMRQIGSTKAYTRTQESPRPVATQFHHLMTERKRREKLNESFIVLRTLLSPDTRKDRVSVLAGTRDCMNAMREQISCLEEKNRALEAHLTAPEDPTDEAESSGERVEIRVNRMPESSSSQLGHQIELRVTVRVKCDAVGLLLRVLRRLKEMGSLSVVSMEARGFSRHGNPFGRAILKIQIEVGEWDEAAFMEAVTSAVDDGLAAPR